VVQKVTGVGANFGTGVALAGKTGTTNDSTDAWFIGFTPRLTAAVWMGYRDGSKPMVNLFGASGGAQGGGEPATLWRHFMTAVTNNGTNPAYTGAFPAAPDLGGALIGSPSSLVSFPKGLGVATTTTIPTVRPTGPAVTTPVTTPITPVSRPTSSTTVLPVVTTTLPKTTTTLPKTTTTTLKKPG
jgi:penicillin-binding protein 1A